MQTLKWDNLNKLRELDGINDEEFRLMVLDYLSFYNQLPAETLDKLTMFRIIEITNGCVQHAFRAQHSYALSIQLTRTCMKLSMGFIKNQYLFFPSRGGRIDLTYKEKEILENGRALYISAFKKHNEEDRKQYYASAVAQFIAFGKDRVKAIQALVQQDYGELFTMMFIRIGQDYVAPYLEISGE